MKKMFNFKLYVDALKQLKIVGIMGAVLIAFAAIAILVGYNISAVEYEAVNVQYIDILSANPLVLLGMFVLTPIMIMMLFNFLNRRNACDFFHAIPDKRESVFNSYIAAIVTWNAFFVVESYVLTFIMDLLLPMIRVEYGNAFVIFVAIMAGVLFMIGAMSIAMSLTGTIFTNFLVTAMILIVPRTIVTIVVLIITEAIPMIPFDFGDTIINHELNVVTNAVTGVVFGRGDYVAITSWKSILYTMAAALIYLSIGGVCFKKRKSEAATCAAVTPKLQCVFRLIPAIMISLMPLCFIFEMVTQYGVDDDSVFIVVVVYGIAILSYFIYELITTKKLKNLIKAIPGTLWIVVYNVVMFGILMTGYNVLLNDIPDAEEVEGVTVVLDTGRYYYTNPSTDYYQSVMEDTIIVSDEIEKILVDELARNVEIVKNKGNVYSYSASENDYILDCVTVTFKCGGREKNRDVYLSNEAGRKIFDLIADYDELQDKMFAVVSKEELNGIYNSNESLTLDEYYEVYKVYMDELKKLEPAKAFAILTNVDNSDPYVRIRLQTNSGYVITMSIVEETVKTRELYYEMINDKSQGKNPLNEFITNYEIWSVTDSLSYYDVNSSMNFSLYTDETRYSGYAYYSYYKNDNYSHFDEDFTENGKLLLEKMGEKVEELQNKPIDLSGEILEICYNYYEYDEKTGTSKDSTYSKFIMADDELIQMFLKYIGENTNDVAVEVYK